MLQKFKQACLSRKHGKAEIIVFLVYCIGLWVIEQFHEPWFDEAQAWQIARCASLREIVFEIQHYEGHPPLWHLLLVPLAKSGVPFELGLFSVNFVFCAATVALLLWRSPFPKILRCYLPFTYFIFYQYGIISRPYSMAMLAILLAAMAYSGRNAHSVRYILSLIFLCSTSAFCILLAGGLCILWTAEIFMEYKKSRQWGNVIKDKRPYVLLAILLYALFLLSLMLPAEDCYYGSSLMTPMERLENSFYLLIIPFESVAGIYLGNDGDFTTTGGLIADCIGGVIFWLLIISFLHINHRKALFLLPYSLYTLFGTYFYFAAHHLGISVMYMIFVLWIIYQEDDVPTVPAFFQKIESGMIRKIAGCVGIILLILSPVASGVASVNDIRFFYGTIDFVNFIKENHLENKKIMLLWLYNYKVDAKNFGLSDMILDETLPAKLPEIDTEHNYPYVIGFGSSVNAYFDHNVFMNFNTDDPDCLYMKWRKTENPTEIYKSWHDQGLPDFVIGAVPLQDIYSKEELEGVTYYWVDEVKNGVIWKFEALENATKVYLRSDLLDEYPQFEKQTYAQKAKEPD